VSSSSMRWILVLAVLVTVAIAVAGSRHHHRGIGAGPGPACVLPVRSCGVRCDDLVQMHAAGSGFVDLPLPGEELAATSTSYLRRDLAALVEYAAAKVACKAADWDTGIGGPIVLGDMSESDGATPGTQWNAPRHPVATHEGGRDIDIAYYQRDVANNELRPICRHLATATSDAYHCVAEPERLDAWRTALFLGALLEEPQVRVIGVDGRAAPPILAALVELCTSGWVEREACARRNRIVFETSDTGKLWFRGHHNHLHVSWKR